MVTQTIKLIEDEIFESINNLYVLLASIKKPVQVDWQETFLECLKITLPVIKGIKDRSNMQLNWIENQFKYYNPTTNHINYYEYEGMLKNKKTDDDEDNDFPL